jgi:hypothetical protein
MNTTKPLQLKTQQKIVALAVALISLTPLIIYSRMFSRLFWFGDELHLLLEIQDQGFYNWLFTPFAENFCPLFKLLWGGAAISGGGSYWIMLLILWGTHALNVFLLVTFLRRVHLPFVASAFVALIFGLSWSNIETLGWTVQWSAVLSITFFFLGLHCALGKRSSINIVLLFLCSLASCFCFSRGVLAASCLALFAASLPEITKWRRFWSFFACFSPALFTAGLISALSGGNHRELGLELLSPIFLHAIHIFSLNPLFQLFASYGLESRELALWVPLKGLVILLAIFAVRKQRLLALSLLCFLAFDVGNSLLLGLGRFHEGTVNTVSWRYQYVSLFCFLPFLAALLEPALKPLRKAYIKKPLALALLISCSYFSYAPWQEHLRVWVKDRGKQGRAILLRGNTEAKWQGIPGFMSWQQSKSLVRTYNLH